MALAATMVWEVRRGKSGSGGFVPGGSGSDYSQQDSPQISDPSDWETKGGTYNKLYSSSQNANLVAALVDNTIKIAGDGGSGAFTAGTYQITGSGNDAGGNYITLDRNCATGNAADGNGVIGGAADIEDIDSKVVAGNHVYIKYDATDYAPSGTVSFTANGSVSVDTIIEGYETTRGDAPGPSGNRPVFACAGNYFGLASYYLVKNIEFETTGASYALYGVNGITLKNVRAKNTNAIANRYGAYIGANPIVIDSEFECTNGRALRIGGLVHLQHCYFHDSNEALLSFTTGSSLVFCTIAGCTTGIPIASITDVSILRCTLDGNGVAVSVTTGQFVLRNCQLSNNTTGVNRSSAGREFIDHNNWYNNGTDVNNCSKGDNATANNPGYGNAGADDFSDVDDTDAFSMRLAVG